jgi:hypothetical protein
MWIGKINWLNSWWTIMKKWQAGSVGFVTFPKKETKNVVEGP